MLSHSGGVPGTVLRPPLNVILMTLFLLAPELSRLTDFFFLNRTVGPSSQPPLFRTLRASRMALALQLLFGIYLVGVNTYKNWTGWYASGGGGIKSPFYGIWDVDQLTIDGQLRPPLITDHDGWRRVIFDLPTSVNFQNMDDSFAGYGASINLQEKTIALTKGTNRNWKANFTFQRPAPDQLTLDGTMDNHRIRMQLQLVDRKWFPLVNRKFHWIAEYLSFAKTSAEAQNGGGLGGGGVNTIIGSIQQEDSGGGEPGCAWSAHI